MTERTFKLYSEIIRAQYQVPTQVKIYVPEIPGSLDNVLVARTPVGQHVFKFGDKETVQKNAQISRMYGTVKKIPVPQITANEYNDISFETYPIIEGPTLYQAINSGSLTHEQIKKIYREIVAEFAKMVKVAPIHLYNNQKFKFHNFAREHTARVNGDKVAKIFMCLAYLANIGADRDMAIIHADLSPKNTIITNDGHLAGLIDLDSAVICNKNYAFCAMASWYKNLGFDIRELMDWYEEMSGDKLNRTRILAMANLNNFGKKLLWQHKQRQK